MLDGHEMVIAMVVAMITVSRWCRISRIRVVGLLADPIVNAHEHSTTRARYDLHSIWLMVVARLPLLVPIYAMATRHVPYCSDLVQFSCMNQQCSAHLSTPFGHGSLGLVVYALWFKGQEALIKTRSRFPFPGSLPGISGH